jgi:hypothetical protein
MRKQMLKMEFFVLKMKYRRIVKTFHPFNFEQDMKTVKHYQNEFERLKVLIELP